MSDAFFAHQTLGNTGSRRFYAVAPFGVLPLPYPYRDFFAQ